MLDSSLSQFYLGLLVALLAIAAVLLFRQIFKTRRVEIQFSKLQSKLSREKGTAQEYYELGSIYLDKKLFSQAVQLLEKALKSKDLKDTDNIALVCNALGYAHAAQEQYDLAIRRYKEALDKKPDYTTALNNLGFAYEKKQLTVQAVEVYEQALAYDSGNKTAKRRAESLKKRLAPSDS